MVYYRPRDQMREIRYKQQIMAKISLVYVATVSIYKKSDLGKHKKRESREVIQHPISGVAKFKGRRTLLAVVMKKFVYFIMANNPN